MTQLPSSRSTDQSAALSELQELELASRLLEVSSEQDLDRVLSDVHRAVAATVGQSRGRATSAALQAVVADAARAALPSVASPYLTQSAFGGADSVGSQLAEQAGTLLGLELEGLSPPERELEAARQFVRFTSSAFRRGMSPSRRVPPAAAARAATAAAARRYAPGLLRRPPAAQRRPRPHPRPRPYRWPYALWPAGATSIFVEAPPAEKPAGAPPPAPSEPPDDADARASADAAPAPPDVAAPPVDADPAAEPDSTSSERSTEVSQYTFESDNFEYEADAEEYGELFESESPLDEVEEMELAAHLLEVRDEAELEEFLGKLFKHVARGVGGFIASPAGKALGGILKNVAAQALPAVGAAMGSVVAPGIGTAIGGKLGSMASDALQVDTEGLDREEAEYEVARKVVQLAAEAAKNTALAQPNIPPRVAVQQAITAAAQKHAPGLLDASPNGKGSNGHRPLTGRWVRQGHRITLLDV